MGMQKHYQIERIFNNNVVLVQDPNENNSEIILLGKGIGFGEKPGKLILQSDPRIEKKFRMENEKNIQQYQTLINQVDEAAIGISEEIIALIAKEISPSINEHVHVALPDHIHFAIHRLRNGLEIVNPFLIEIKTLYSKEFALAKKAAEMITDSFDVEIPESEIGFLALHIHSAISYIPVAKAVQFTNLITELVALIEQKTSTHFERDSIDYMRLVTHLRFTIERIGEQKSIKNPLLEQIMVTMPREYELASELAHLISEKIELAVSADEIGYMAMHLYRVLQQAE